MCYISFSTKVSQANTKYFMKKNDASYPRFAWVILVMLLLNLGATAFILFKKPNAGVKLAYVDAVKVINKYKGTEDARKEIVARYKQYSENLDTLKNELRALSATLVQLGTAQQSKKTALEAEIVAKRTQISQYEQIVRENAQKADQEISKKLLDKVNAQIKKIGDSEGYSIILTATAYGNIAYGEKGIDITDQVVAGLNKELTQ
jgi:outer membrane protein